MFASVAMLKWWAIVSAFQDVDTIEAEEKPTCDPDTEQVVGPFHSEAQAKLYVKRNWLDWFPYGS